jgi:hypothetical protein
MYLVPVHVRVAHEEGGGRSVSTHSQIRHSINMSRQIHIPAALSQEKIFGAYEILRLHTLHPKMDTYPVF